MRKQSTETKYPICCRTSRLLERSRIIKEMTSHIANTAALRGQLPRNKMVHLNERKKAHTGYRGPVQTPRRACCLTGSRCDCQILPTRHRTLLSKDLQNMSDNTRSGHPQAPRIPRLVSRQSSPPPPQIPEKGFGNVSTRKEMRFRIMRDSREVWNGDPL